MVEYVTVLWKDPDRLLSKYILALSLRACESDVPVIGGQQAQGLIPSWSL
jgi:hypothetical protein